MKMKSNYFPLAITLTAFFLPEISSNKFKTNEQRQNFIDILTSELDIEGYEVRLGNFDVFSKETCQLPENEFYCKGECKVGTIQIVLMQRTPFQRYQTK